MAKLKEFAFTELFNYYARKNNNDKPNDFQNMQEGLKRLNLKGYVSFVKDMQIPIDM